MGNKLDTNGGDASVDHKDLSQSTRSLSVTQ